MLDNVKFECELVADDFGKGNLTGQSHWRVTINGFSTDYHMGCGHRVWMRTIIDPGQFNVKQGDRVRVPHRVTLHQESLLCKYTKPSKPVLRYVLECLYGDARCGELTFEDFCSESGYDTDSRKAFEIHQACRDTFFALRQIFDLDELGDYLDSAN